MSLVTTISSNYIQKTSSKIFLVHNCVISILREHAITTNA